MATGQDIESLKKISSEIDESQINVLYSTQYLKAQEYLIKKLKKTTDRDKERCSYVFSANIKLEADIKQTELEIQSLLVAQDAIKKGNIELKKEVLKAEEEILAIIERTKNGEKKYEDMWIECKAKYESLPHVQRLLKAKDEAKNLQVQLEQLENEEKMVKEAIHKKKEACKIIDRERIIKLAEFMAVERPKMIETIKEKTAAVQAIQKKLAELENVSNENRAMNEESVNSKDNQCNLILPRLQLDFDNLNENMDKISRDDILDAKYDSTYSVHSVIVIDPTKTTKKSKTPNLYNNYSTFFYNPSTSHANKTQNYAKKKLINILEDITIDQNEAQMIISEINPDVLQPVQAIAAHGSQGVENVQEARHSQANILENEHIEDINLTSSNIETLVQPPSQFLDASQKELAEPTNKLNEEIVSIQRELAEPTNKLNEEIVSIQRTSQEDQCKKQVTFDLSNIEEAKDDDDLELSGVDNANETNNSQLDVSDEGFAKMKDMIMKKHNIDLSPQFVYAKNTTTPKKPEKAVFTSKFFPQENIEMEVDIQSDGMQEKNNQVKEDIEANSSSNTKYTAEMDSDSKAETLNIQPVQAPSGFLFGVSTPMANMEDESMNASGFEDFPMIDSGLLLSPKANTSTAMESQEEISQDVPNFLSGLRKTGQSFFGHLAPSESKPDSSGSQTQAASGFSFNFGGEEKKSRGGLFSLFQ